MRPQTTLYRGNFIVLEGEPRAPLCMVCADMDHLDCLPSGSTTLTRRGRKDSRLCAVNKFDFTAIDLAVRAHIRHRHTRYDEILAQGWERVLVREEVRDELWEPEEAWLAEESPS